MLLNAQLAMGYLRLYRVAFIEGRYGGGKTSLAFRMAHDLLRSGQYRYLLSNVKSVWTDALDTVVPRDGYFLDAAGFCGQTRSIHSGQ